MIKVNRISGKGRGVIATQLIPKEGLIEAAPACAFPPEQRKLIDATVLFPYYFVRRSEYGNPQKLANGYIVFGLSSFCNHSEDPNAEIKWVEDDGGLWVYLTALKTISPDEEVTIFYTNIVEYPLAHQFK